MRLVTLRVLAASALLALAGVTGASAAPGDLDPSFGGDGIASVDWLGTDIGEDVVVQPDGKIVVVGTGVSSLSDIGVSRFNADGSLDNSGFDSDARAFVNLGGTEQGHAVALEPDGSIVVAGETSVGARALIARFKPNGAVDTGFAAGEGATMGYLSLEYGGLDAAQDVAVQPDGKIVTAGYGGPGMDFQVTRLTAAGVRDPGFHLQGAAIPGTTPIDFAGDDQAFAVAIQPNGKVVVAGSTNGGAPFVAVARLNADGTPDTSFDGDGKVTLPASAGTAAHAVAVQPDGKIVIAADHGGDFAISRLNSNGSLDEGFGGIGSVVVDLGGSDLARGLALQANGKIIATGQRSGSAAVLTRLQPGGAIDTTFHGTGRVVIDAGGSIYSAFGVALQPDGRILIAGDTNPSVVQVPRDVAVARLQGDPPASGGGPPGGGPGGGGPTAKVPRCAGRKATIVGTNKSNKLKGTRRNDVIVALGGNDKIDGGRGNDLICAGDGNDNVKGGPGKDRLYGQNGKDTESGGDGDDKLDGGAGNDKLKGDGGNDKLTGGAGNDSVSGGAGKDGINGGAGKDRLSGGAGKDSCNGGAGKDRASCEHSRAV